MDVNGDKYSSLPQRKNNLPIKDNDCTEAAEGYGPPAEKMPRFADEKSNVSDNQTNTNIGEYDNSGENSKNDNQNQDKGKIVKGFGNLNNENGGNYQYCGGQQNRDDFYNHQNGCNKQQNMSTRNDDAERGSKEQNYKMQRTNQNNSNQNRSSGGRANNRCRGGNRLCLVTSDGYTGGDHKAAHRADEFLIEKRLREISGPTHDLSPIVGNVENKFCGRNRLYVGNLSNDMTEEELRELFKPYGEIDDIYANFEKSFTFLKIDYHANAEKAKRELDGHMYKGRALRVRLAPNATFVRVKNLSQVVSNELLYKSFEIFGLVERANIIVDDRGKHTGEGIVEFTKKTTANLCLRYCHEKCFFLTASVRPVIVEPYQFTDDFDGIAEKQLNNSTPEFHRERSLGPRFAEFDTFEHDYGTKWKKLHELYKGKIDEIKRELSMEEKKLETQMENARYEYETEVLRRELRKRESDMEYKKKEYDWNERNVEEPRIGENMYPSQTKKWNGIEEMRQRNEENMRQQQNTKHEWEMRQRNEENMRQQQNKKHEWEMRERSIEEMRLRDYENLRLQQNKRIEWEMREKSIEEMRKRTEENMRQQHNEMQMRLARQEEEMRRRQQAHALFMQAQQLNLMLDQQEQGLRYGEKKNIDFNSNSSNTSFDFRGINNSYSGGYVGGAGVGSGFNGSYYNAQNSSFGEGNTGQWDKRRYN